MMINRKKFYDKYRDTFGNIKKEQTVESINAILTKFERTDIKIKAIEKMAYILATVRHECGPHMQPITENLNYSAKRLMQVWPSRFPTMSHASKYSNQPVLLGNVVYGGRLGNGSLEGYKYRGRGFVQITGYDNYKKFGIEENPEEALKYDVGAMILVDGILGGVFTGKKLSGAINGRLTDYVAARAVINADMSRVGADIAKDAKKFEEILRYSI